MSENNLQAYNMVYKLQILNKNVYVVPQIFARCVHEGAGEQNNVRSPGGLVG